MNQVLVDETGSGADGRQPTPDHADLVADWDAILGALAALPHRQREVTVLRFYADLWVALITSGATVGVVPDGVARVKWELANPGQTKAVTVYPRVSGNTAAAPWTPAPRSTGLINEQLLVGATWYDARGRVTASFHDGLVRIGKADSP